MSDRMQLALEECLDLLRQGLSIEQCLARFPADRAELARLLETAVAADRQLAVDLPMAVRDRMRNRVLAEWDRKAGAPRRRWWFPALLPRWAAAAAILVVALMGSGAGTAMAAGDSLPGDLLYPVKELREGAQLWFSRSPEAKVSMYSELVKRRAEEIRELAGKDQERSGNVDHAVERMSDHLASLDTIARNNLQQPLAEPAGKKPELLEAFRRAVARQQVAESILTETLADAPGADRADLLKAAEVIRQARDRVNAALEAVGVPRPLDGEEDVEGDR